MQSPARAAAERVTRWIAANSGAFAPILELDLRHEPCLALDFTATSPLVDPSTAGNDEPALTARIHRAMRDAGVRLAAGRYDERRPPYASDADADTDPRSVHLGVDLFVEPGMMVHAPIAGVVHDAGESRSARGYGPTVVLRHETDDATPFFTLYGHLDPETLSRCTPGRSVAPGAQLGRVGTPDVNGGWTPHLHFQLIIDLLGLGRRFPGVGHLSQRDAWRVLSPDPNLILEIPVLS